MRCSVIDKSLDVPANQDKLSIGDVKKDTHHIIYLQCICNI